jgi:RNA-directed DNA polymerase
VETWLKAGVMTNGEYTPTESGVPQGGLCKALHNDPYAKQVTMQREVRITVMVGHFQLNSFA